MWLRSVCAVVLLLVPALEATIIDQIAIVVNDRIIKDSDIDRDLRVVSFLNDEKLEFNAGTRKAAANRLIDQAIIQREIQVGEYQTPTETDVTKLLNELLSSRFHSSAAAFHRVLSNYGLTETELKRYLLWQLTVLRFVDQRFRPAVLVTDEDVTQYYNDHRNQFQAPLETARSDAKQALTEDRINQQFENWLKARRKNAGIAYKEGALK